MKPPLAPLGEELRQGLARLNQHRLRSLLTMLGMIFGVGAVVAMLSIGEGARRQVMALIEQLGVRNLIVESREITDPQMLQSVRKLSPGLTLGDYRLIRANLVELEDASPRKRYVPSGMIPKPARGIPSLSGVEPSYARIAGLRLQAGRFFDDAEAQRAAPVCVLGESARSTLFGQREALGEYVKADNQWFRVIGVAAPLLAPEGGATPLASVDTNHLIYVPLRSVLLRLEDSRSRLKDEIDGIYLRLADGTNGPSAAEVVRGILDHTHRRAGDYSVIVPAELLAEEQRTRRVFDIVMVALAAVSLLVGGIGIMNTMLASVIERTHEIGIRRAVGARQKDILRQFLMEAVLISLVGGLIGMVLGVAASKVIALTAGWSTIVSVQSVFLAFVVSVSVGLTFGIFPAAKAARLDPVEAIRYE